MQAKDVMTEFVISVEPGDTVLHAIRVMLQNDISGLPVIDKARRLVGILTEGDLLRRAETGTERRRPRWLEILAGPGRLAEEYTRTHARRVEEIMTAEPVTTTEDTPLEDVVRLMEKHRIKRLPVVRGNLVVGIVSRANLLHALAGTAHELAPAAVSDGVIRDQLFAELRKQSWAPLAALDIGVRNGVVDLWGTIVDERHRQALIVAAENIPGVTRVRDHLVWVDTMSGMVFLGPQQDDDKPGKVA